MYNFILQILLMLSLGVMIYLVARKVPQIIDVVDENQGEQKLFSKIDKFIASLPFEKLDFIVSQMLEKMLRKLKLFFMKLDNQLTHHLKKFKDKAAANQEHFKRSSLFDKTKEGGEIEEGIVEKENNAD